MEAKILAKIKLLDADQIELGIGFPIRCLGITLLRTASICLKGPLTYLQVFCSTIQFDLMVLVAFYISSLICS